MQARVYSRAFALIASAALAACGGSPGSAPSTAFLPAQPGAPDVASSSGRIKHIVIIVQENRSFDNFFATYPGVSSSQFGYMHTGKRIRLYPSTYAKRLLAHAYSNAIADYDGGKMDGFDLGTQDNGLPDGKDPYTYVQPNLIKPYWDLAHKYVLADHMFPSMMGPSFTAHLTLIAGTADLNPSLSEVDQPTLPPWGCDAPAGTTTNVLNSERVESANGPFPCFTQFRTMADTLDERHVSWKYYAPSIAGGDYGGTLWSEFDAIKNVRYGSDWANVVTPQTTVLTDPAAGKLASVSWVIPDWADSDHPWNGSDTGPSWVASVVNAIGASPSWKSTAIFVVWDDWGGFYDNVSPPALDFRGLGIRVPCLIISPYAKKNYVSHTQYEFGSILKFIEETFHLRPLGSVAAGYTDRRANSPDDSFDFTKPARQFTPITVDYSAKYFLRRPASGRPPDTE